MIEWTQSSQGPSEVVKWRVDNLNILTLDCISNYDYTSFVMSISDGGCRTTLAEYDISEPFSKGKAIKIALEILEEDEELRRDIVGGIFK